MRKILILQDFAWYGLDLKDICVNSHEDGTLLKEANKFFNGEIEKAIVLDYSNHGSNYPIPSASTLNSAIPFWYADNLLILDLLTESDGHAYGDVKDDIEFNDFIKLCKSKGIENIYITNTD